MIRIFLFALLICLYVSNVGLADGVVRDAIGARTTGRGGVNIGYADNGGIIIDNPAGLSNIDGFGFTDFGFDTLFTDLSYEDLNDSRTSASNSPFPLGQVSIVRRTALPNVSVGLGVFSQAGFSSKYRQLNPTAPFTSPETYKAVGALAKFLPAMSLAVSDRLSVGGTFGVAVNHMELEGPYFLQGPSPFAGTPTLFDLQATGAAIAWSTGLQYALTPKTTLGVAYQSKNEFSLSGSTHVEIAGLGASRFDSEVEVTWPSSLGIGFQHLLGARTNFGFDVLFRNWESAFRSFDVTLTNPDNPVFAAVIGPELNESFPLDWRDTVTYRFGLERELIDQSTLRFGYVYHRNPIPASTLTPFIQATLEHAFSLGYGKRVGPYDLDFGYQYSFGPDQSVGVSGLLGGDFNGSTVATSAHWASVSAIRRF